MQRLNLNFAGDTIGPSSLLHGVADVGGRGKQRGAPDEGKLTEVSSIRAGPGPHDWGSSWEGLTQTRPALLRAEDPEVLGPHGWWCVGGEEGREGDHRLPLSSSTFEA